MKLVTSSQLVARDERECRIGQQSGALDSQFVQASICHVHGVGLQLGGGRLQLSTAVASLVEELPGVPEKLIDFRKSRAQLILFELQQPLTRLTRIALSHEVGGLLLELQILCFALPFLGGRCFNL
jgi:hypothetical protein